MAIDGEFYSFVLFCKGKSLNHSKAIYKGRMIPSQKFKEDKKEYEILLKPHVSAIKKILNNPDAQKHGITIRFYFAYENFYTKKEGTISKAIPDLDNSLKGLIDCIFEAAGVEDNIVTSINAWKGQTTNKDHISISISANLPTS